VKTGTFPWVKTVKERGQNFAERGNRGEVLAHRGTTKNR